MTSFIVQPLSKKSAYRNVKHKAPIVRLILKRYENVNVNSLKANATWRAEHRNRYLELNRLYELATRKPIRLSLPLIGGAS